ncbi:Tryptophan synthase, beta chain [Penicillium roqueforti FM164]|uniref:Tryptophan synthase, beta chain n=1 Tax=Penicillium roqueforti (strain FM164) TaxID=1365484 RepID=W6QGI0_PENRF|nr:Tryptophan synthase, beta chain [Penicillium roqueforti FM164]
MVLVQRLALAMNGSRLHTAIITCVGGGSIAAGIQISNTQFISVGLDYPGVGPELASWKESGRMSFVSANNTNVLEAFSLLGRMEGIVPA